MSGDVNHPKNREALVLSVRGKTPVIPESCWLAPTATVIGDTTMGEDCSVWFNAVIRGDVNSIQLGDRVNVQDNAVIHCTYEKWPTVIGDDVSIAHNAVVHGCTIHDRVLIGMGSVVMDGCVVESNCIIAAGSVVTQGTHVEAGSIYAGIPAKKVKQLSQETFEGEVQRIARNYKMYSEWYVNR